MSQAIFGVYTREPLSGFFGRVRDYFDFGWKNKGKLEISESQIFGFAQLKDLVENLPDDFIIGELFPCTYFKGLFLQVAIPIIAYDSIFGMVPKKEGDILMLYEGSSIIRPINGSTDFELRYKKYRI